MIKDGLRKKLLIVATVCCMCIGSATVYADKVYESNEDNDSKETACLIQANNETVEGAAEGTYAGQYAVDGKASLTDTDWYKVYLKAGEQYMTCNDYSFDFEISDEDGNVLLRQSYVDDVYGPRAYKFDVMTTGYCYVKITGVTSSSEGYIFMIGSPTYTVGTCEISCEEGKITMTKSGGTQVASFRGDELSDLPDEAIAYYVGVRGVSTTSAKSMTVSNIDTGKSISMPRYTWYKDSLVYMHMPVESEWKVSFEYYQNTSFTPKLKIYYAYPILDTIIQ